MCLMLRIFILLQVVLQCGSIQVPESPPASPGSERKVWKMFSFRHSHSPPPSSEDCTDSSQLDVAGLVCWVVFCLLILMVGLAAGWVRRDQERSPQEVMLAGRRLDFFVGVLTMAATWVGGGFIIGAAQGVYSNGLLWSQAPVFYSLSLVVGGLVFAKKMRDSEYLTMVDPFTQKFGRWGSVLVLPAALSEMVWCAAILSSLGSTLYTILQLDDTVSIIISAGLSLAYTMFGGLVSVAYTDVIQILFVMFGLFLALPFSISHPAVGDLYSPQEEGLSPAWWGTVGDHEWGAWLDVSLLCLLGGVPWQSYFQRVLSAQSGGRAVLLSCGGSLIALVLSVPALLFGAVAASTDWSLTGRGCLGAPHGENARYVLPLCLKFLTPRIVSWLGVGVVSAAVMSSADSSLLSSSSLLARNFYQKLLRPGCGEVEVVRALWVFTVINCLCSTLLALQYNSVYELYVLCGDLTYVLLFPQLLLVLYLPQANTYGSLSSFVLSLVLRLLVGDKFLGVTQHLSLGVITAACPTVHHPELVCTAEVPYRSIIMLVGLTTHVTVSCLTHFLFCVAHIPLNLDVLGCFHKVDEEGNVGARNTRYLDGPVQNLKVLPTKTPRLNVEFL